MLRSGRRPTGCGVGGHGREPGSDQAVPGTLRRGTRHRGSGQHHRLLGDPWARACRRRRHYDVRQGPDRGLLRPGHRLVSVTGAHGNQARTRAGRGAHRLVLRTGEHELLRLPADGWLEVRAPAIGPPPKVESLLDELCVDLGFCLPPDERVPSRTHHHTTWMRSPMRSLSQRDSIRVVTRGCAAKFEKGLRVTSEPTRRRRPTSSMLVCNTDAATRGSARSWRLPMRSSRRARLIRCAWTLQRWDTEPNTPPTPPIRACSYRCFVGIGKDAGQGLVSRS
jgi:hypothetical protein